MDRHHLLDLFEKIHETYKLKDQDYKLFVEALGGKKEPIDVTGAKVVLINYDRIDECFDDDEEEPYVYPIQNIKKILKVIPSEDPMPHLGHRNSTLGVEYMKCLTHLKECEIRAPVVQKIANWIASGDLYKWQDNMTIFRFNSVEVLHRE